jgi:hypothetical protein
MDDRISQILKRWNLAKQARKPWESLWQQCAEWVMPQSPSMLFGQESKSGEKRGQKAYDGTPESANDVFTSGLHSGITPPNQKWFRWQAVPFGLNKVPAVRAWLEECEEITFFALNNSNWNQSINSVYRQIGAFGTAVNYIEEDLEKILRFSVFKLSDIAVIENRRNQVDTLFRSFKWSARNAFEAWGAKCPDVVKTAMQNNSMDLEFDFLHVVAPRSDFDPANTDRLNMPFQSLWIYPANKTVMDEGGYREFPYIVSRAETYPGEVYGRGPAIKALQDIGVLNQQEVTNLKAAHKMVEPPLQVPEDGFSKAIDLSPRAINLANRTAGGYAKIEPIITGLNLPYAIEQQERKAAAVRQRFFVDVFLMLSDHPDMTATEVLERKQEKLLILGPVLGRLQTETIDPVLDRVFRIMFDGGHFPAPPDELLMYAKDIKTEYLSPLALAQRMADVQATRAVYMDAAMIAKATGRTDAIDTLKDDEAIRLIAERHGAPAEILRSKEEVAQIIQARQQEMQEQAAMQQALAATQGAKDLAAAKMNPEDPNALTETAKAMGG